MTELERLLEPMARNARQLEVLIAQMEDVQRRIDQPAVSLQIAELIDRMEREQHRIAAFVVRIMEMV